MRSSPSGSPLSLVVWCPAELWMGDHPVQVKFECKEVDPLAKTAELYTIRLVKLTRIESPPWAFQRAINKGRASSLTFAKLGSDTQICRFSQKFRPKTIKSLLQSFSV